MTLGLQKALAAILAAVFILSGSETPPDTGSDTSGSSETEQTIEKVELARKMAWEYMADHNRPETQTPFVFSRENFPRLAVTVSGEPLARGTAERLLGESRESVSDLIQTGTAVEACQSLMNGSADVVITAEPDKAVWDAKDAAGFEWDMTPVAVDALVFVVNADNPVDNLTAAQVRDIFTGKVTNWSEVGGEDRAITVLQRCEGSGCRTALQNLVLDGVSDAASPTVREADTLDDLAEAVRTSGSAIGCTSWYCASRQYASAGWKILSIDGVTPDTDSIRSASYPFLNNLYIVTAAGQSGAAHALYDWLLGGEGRQLASREGYVPAEL